LHHTRMRSLGKTA